MRADQAYDELMRRVREESLLTSIEALLEWDEETYMPARRGGQPERAVGAGGRPAARTRHRSTARASCSARSRARTCWPIRPHPPRSTSASSAGSTSGSVRLPRALVEDVARTTALAQKAWADARAASDFDRFRPWLERIVSLKRREAECVGYADEPYDALLEDYEPGLRSAGRGPAVRGASARAGAARRPHRRRAASTRRLGAAPPLSASTASDGSASGSPRRSASTSRAGGWIWASIRRAPGSGPATAASPCGSTSAISPADCSPSSTRWATGCTSWGSTRRTTARRWARRRRWAWTKRRRGSGRTGSAASRRFWDHFYPKARELFPESLGDVPIDEFHFAVNRVAPSLIRVNADEVTYNLHVMIRFELERALIVGRPAPSPTCPGPGTTRAARRWACADGPMRTGACRTATGPTA